MRVSVTNPKSRRTEIQSRLRNTRPVNLPGYRQRLIWVWVLLCLGQCALVARLFWLQIIKAPTLRQDAEAQRTLKLSPKVALHPIVDRNGNILAKDEPTFRLFVHPFLFNKEQQEIAKQLSTIINIPEEQLLKLFTTAKSGIPVTRDLHEDSAAKIRDLRLDGVELTREWTRTYPQKDLTSGLVGYVDAEHLGQAGLEYSMQALLKAKPPSTVVSEDGNGYLLPNQFP
ncbi:MAG TPA: hypothetical protein V6D19_10995, partial [Stenomitos sp.]